MPSLRRAVAAIDPDLPLSNVRTMDDHIARALARPAFLSTLVSSFGVLAVLLAIVGVYGMMSWSVAERRREIAIRMALGASRQGMLGMVLRRAVVLAALGIGGGLFLAPLAAQVLTGFSTVSGRPTRSRSREPRGARDRRDSGGRRPSRPCLADRAGGADEVVKVPVARLETGDWRLAT